MEYIILILAALCSISFGSHGYLKDEEFHQWVARHYTGDEDLATIYPTWKENANFVKKQNSLGLSYTLTMNKFGHLKSERLPLSCCTAPSVPNTLEKYDQPNPVRDIIPDSIDWRVKGVVSPVRNQGALGQAAPIAIVESIQSYIAIKTSHLGSASVQEFIDCCRDYVNIWSVDAYTCIAKLGGLAADSDYKSNGTCASDKYPARFKIAGGKWVTPMEDEEALAQAVAMQPIAVAVDAGCLSFQMYSSGIYDDQSCSKSIHQLDHAILVVGYGSSNGTDYWICQNSWGTSWGMDGYILIARNSGNVVGIASAAMYPY